ncbi:MAG: hypothetical protein Q9186_000770 [Xanthomendoza sp. 1 TL-2023]
MEPVTTNALMDTLLAQIETLSSIAGLLSTRGAEDPGWIDQYFQESLLDKILLSSEKAGRQQEVALAEAKFRCALSDANFSAANIDVSTYEAELARAYKGVSEVDQVPQALCDRADAEIVFNANVQKVSTQFTGAPAEDRASLNVIRWKHLTKALDNLTVAGRLRDAKNLPRIHLRRGDCELLRRRLGQAPTSYDIALKSASTLLKNAEIYYRGAARLAKAEGAIDEEAEALTKEAVVAVFLGDQSRLRERVLVERSSVQEVVEDMIEEGLVLEEDIRLLSL